MENKAQSFKKALSHLTSLGLCYKKTALNHPYSVCWDYEGNFYMTIRDGWGYGSARLGTDVYGRWVLQYVKREGEEMGILMAEATEEEDIILDSYFEDPLNPTDEEAILFCLLFANLSGFLVEVSNRILEEEANCGE